MKLSIKILICVLAFFIFLAAVIFVMSLLKTDGGENTTTDPDIGLEEDTLGPPIEFADEDDLDFVLINGGKEYAVLCLSDAEGAAHITIPEKHNDKPVTAICNGAFTGDSNLVELFIPDSVIYIGTNAFSSCPNLTDLTISDNLIYLGMGAFGDCAGLVYKEYGNAYYLGDKNEPYMILTYVKNRQIKSCEIHPDTKIICESAFADCVDLETVTMPDSLVYVGTDAFSGCLSLEYSAKDESASYLGNENNPYLVCVKGNSKRTATSYTIQEGTKIIVPYAFRDCPQLTHVTLPSSLSLIGKYAFTGCDKLVGVDFTALSDWCVISDNNVYEANVFPSNSEHIVKLFTEVHPDSAWVKQ